MTRQKVAVVTGVGPGTGLAITKRLIQDGYVVAMIARDSDRLLQFSTEIPGAYSYAGDVSDQGFLSDALDRIESELGSPEVLVHNAVGGAFGNFLEVDSKTLEDNFKVNVTSLLVASKRLAPSMIDLGKGAIIVTGNTSAWRGKSKFAAFAPTKAAQRILAESIARELAPKGIHVSYLTIDAVIDVPWTRKRYPDVEEDFFIKPEVIASEVLHLINQPRGGWSFNAELRPYKENW